MIMRQPIKRRMNLQMTEKLDQDTSMKSTSKSENKITDESESEKDSHSEGMKQTRIKRKPVYLDDYVTRIEAFMTENDPMSYTQAMKRPDRNRWKAAMDTEINSMHSNNA